MKAIPIKGGTVVKVGGILTEPEKDKGIAYLVARLEGIVNEINGTVFLISHSSGADIILRAKLPTSVRGWALWSPSLLSPQSVTLTLVEKNGMLIHEGSPISRKIAEDMDALDTAKLIPDITIPIHLYISEEGSGWLSRLDLISAPHQITHVPYQHNYTDEQKKHLFEITCRWFYSLNILER